MKELKHLFLLAAATSALLLAGCEGCDQPAPEPQPDPQPVSVEVPPFNADSAYYFVEKQVAFGPRVPNTEAHKECGDWLIQKLEAYTDKVYVQDDVVMAYDNTKLNFRNIIGSFNPDAGKRIFLCAHWDTRPYADQDPDKDRYNDPIAGANDGGSGVGVLLEVARVISSMPVDMGVDIILFDVEDYGQPDDSDLPTKNDTYCLGSQYWATNPHVGGYNAKYGILLDMVGDSSSRFLQEQYSLQYAPTVVRKTWNIAAELGHTQYFKFQQSSRPIVDDHVYINVISGIPTIDIISLDNTNPNLFPDSWHTHQDDMSRIDSRVLGAVGETVVNVVYRENAGQF